MSTLLRRGFTADDLDGAARRHRPPGIEKVGVGGRRGGQEFAEVVARTARERKLSSPASQWMKAGDGKQFDGVMY